MLKARMPGTRLLIAALIGLVAVPFLLSADSVSSSGHVTFSDLPAHHGGNEFDFTLTYDTDDHPTSYVAVRDDEVEVTNATVLNAKRAHKDEADRNKVWTVTIDPNNGQDDVTITVDDVSVTVPASAPPPPTPAVEDGAELSDLPTHHGGDEFTLTVTLSGTPVTSWQTMQDSVVDVDGGVVAKVRRSHQTPDDRNYVWEVTVDPGDHDVTVTVRGESATVPAVEPPVVEEVTPVPTKEPEVARQASDGISFSPASLTLDEGGSSKTFTWSLDRTPTSTSQLRARVSDSDVLQIRTATNLPWASSALFGIDANYGTRAQTMYVRALADSDDDDEQVTVDFSVTSGSYGAPDVSFPITIIDDDKPGLTFEEERYIVKEADQKVGFRVKLANNPNTPVTVALPTRDEMAEACRGFFPWYNIAEEDDEDAGIEEGDVIEQEPLEFTSSTWNTYQTLYVGGLTFLNEHEDRDCEIPLVVQGYESDGATVDEDHRYTSFAESARSVPLGYRHFYVTLSNANANEPDMHPDQIYVIREGTTRIYPTFERHNAIIAPGSLDRWTIYNGTSADSGAVDFRIDSTQFGDDEWVITAVEDVDPDPEVVQVSALVSRRSTLDEQRTLGYLEGAAIRLPTPYTVWVIDDEAVPGLAVAEDRYEIREGADDTEVLVKLALPPADGVGVVVSLPDDIATRCPDLKAGTGPASAVFSDENWNVYQALSVGAVRKRNEIQTRDCDLALDVAAYTDPVDITTLLASNEFSTLADDKRTLPLRYRNIDLYLILRDDDGDDDILPGQLIQINEGDTISGYTPEVQDTDHPDWGIVTDRTYTDDFVALNTRRTSTQVLIVDSNRDSDTDPESITLTVTMTDHPSGNLQPSGRWTVWIDDDDATPGLYFETRRVTVLEGRADNTIRVKLARRPAHQVRVTVPDDVTTSCRHVSKGAGATSVVFGPETWNIFQVISLGGVRLEDERDTADCDVPMTVQAFTDADDPATVQSSDTYSTLTDARRSVPVRYQNIDPALQFNIDELTVGEGETGSVSLVLKSAPRGNITVSISSDDTGFLELVDAGSDGTRSLTFTRSNWSRPQRVQLNAPETNADFQDRTVTITASVSGGSYDAADQTVLVAVINDDAVAGIGVSHTEREVRENGKSDLKVRLEAAPEHDVVVTLTTNDNTVAGPHASAASATLTFTPTNWSQEQTVNIYGREDTEADTDRSATITLSVTSGDYHADPETVAVTVVPHYTPFKPEWVRVHPGLDHVSLAWSPQAGVGRFGDGFFVSLQPSGFSSATTVLGCPPDLVNDLPPPTTTSSRFARVDCFNQREHRVTGLEPDTRYSVNVWTFTLPPGHQDGDEIPKERQSPGVGVSFRTLSQPLEKCDGDWCAPTDFTATLADGNVELNWRRHPGTSTQVTWCAYIVDSGERNFNGWALDATENDDGTLSAELSGPRNPRCHTNATPPYGSWPALVGGEQIALRAWLPSAGFLSAVRGETAIATVPMSETAEDAGTPPPEPEPEPAVPTGPAIIVEPNPLTVTEGGAGVNLGIRLNTQPDSGVTVRLDSSDGSKVVLWGYADTWTITFTRDNWNKPQYIGVSARDDVDSESESETITIDAAALGDYRDAPDVQVTVWVDDDDASPGLVAASQVLDVSEGQTHVGLRIKLARQPAEEVVVTVPNDVGTQCPGIGPGSGYTRLVFTADNWNAYQALSLAGISQPNEYDDQDCGIALDVTAYSDASDPASSLLADPWSTLPVEERNVRVRYTNTDTRPGD